MGWRDVVNRERARSLIPTEVQANQNQWWENYMLGNTSWEPPIIFWICLMWNALNISKLGRTWIWDKIISIRWSMIGFNTLITLIIIWEYPNMLIFLTSLCLESMSPIHRAYTLAMLLDVFLWILFLVIFIFSCPARLFHLKINCIETKTSKWWYSKRFTHVGLLYP